MGDRSRFAGSFTAGALPRRFTVCEPLPVGQDWPWSGFLDDDGEQSDRGGELILQGGCVCQ